MKTFAKWLGYLVGVVCLLLVLVLVGLRYSPDTLVALANRVQSAAEIETTSLNLTYLPLSLSADRINLAMSAQDIELLGAVAKLNANAWWSDTPFWQVQIAKVDVAQHAGSAVAVAPPAGSTDKPASSAGALNVLPYLTFEQIRIDELTVSGDSAVAAQLLAEQDGRDIKISSQGAIAGSPFNLSGTLTRGDSDLVFQLKLESEPTAEDALKAHASLAGSLASSKRLQLTIESGTLMVEQAAQQYRVESLRGQLAVQPDSGGDELEFDGLSGRYVHPGWQQPLAFTTTGTVSQKADRLLANLSLKLGQSNLEIKTTPGEGDWHGQISLQSDGLPADIALTPYQATDLFPLSVTSQVQLDGSRLVLTDISIDSPQNVVAGELSLDTGSDLKLTATLDAQTLYFPLFSQAPESNSVVESEENGQTEAASAAGQVEAASQGNESATVAEISDASTPEPAASARVFSDEPIAWDWLEAADIDVSVTAKAMRIQAAEFAALKIQLTTADGVLKLQPLSATLGDGGFEGDMTLSLAPAPEATAAAAQMTARFAVNGIALESFGFVPQEELQGGDLEVDLELASSGISAHELASKLDGKILIMVQDAVLMNDFVELAGSDLLMETLNKLNPFTKQDPTTELNCALVLFTAEQGKLTTKNQLVMETSKMEIVGNGSVDLAEEKINLTFAPNAKSGVGINVGSLVKFLKLGGTLAAPQPTASAGGLLKSGLAIGAAISTGGASVVAEGLAKRVLTSGSACAVTPADDKGAKDA